MDALAVSPVSPATLSALRPPLALAAPVAQDQGTAGLATQLSTQDLAQTLFQQALQKAVLFPLAEPAGANLAQDAAASLLALTAPQATAPPMATSAATSSNATSNAAAGTALATQAQDAVTTAAATTPALTAELPAVQDSSSLEFALQTALRFGAGVVTQATPPFQPADLAAGLIPDPAAVQRLGNLQPHAGGPGPEAFAHPQAAHPVQRVLRTYELAPTVTEPGQLDLMA
ncbi:MAG TPA: hypothetical protein VGK03_10780 [Geothrix sp.]|jgi:hypothetical protein